MEIVKSTFILTITQKKKKTFILTRKIKGLRKIILLKPYNLIRGVINKTLNFKQYGISFGSIHNKPL